MEDSSDSSDDGFDMIQPTLIQELRKILDQYPDDGQILKELIQNAEDAGASKVKFLCDCHIYGTKKLHHPGLDKFQGPALYAYNNAKFTRDDWRGIRMLCDSIKEHDPTKVGRFGLGFKSVFHMTDLPSIVSDKQVGMLDPHQKYFSGGTGHRWRFKEEHVEMNRISDQFAPYRGIAGFGAETHSSRFDGTLFRFPLREKASKLSDNLYSSKKVLDLLESFKTDAHMVLLFLKNIESIELYVRNKQDPSPRKIFEVKISDECLENVRAKRKEFSEQVKLGEVPSSPVSVTFPITVECTFYGGKSPPRCSYSFLLTNYFSEDQMSSDVRRLMIAEDLSYLPWVGVAMGVENANRMGHLFCFLPLPMQKRSLTGLPVHVNGFFALSQNRRHLKWPTTDQEEEGRELTDKALLWNKFLVKEVVPRAYADLLLESRGKVSLEVFYKAWPDLVQTDPKWQEMLPLLFEQLLQCAIFYTPTAGGKWLKVNEAIFDTLEEESKSREVLLDVLRAANTRIVSAPHHVLGAIAQLHKITTVTPTLMRSVLRRTPSCYKNTGRSTKLLLLKYILKDSRFDDLYDLKLLPLSDGKFVPYTGQRHDAIYISSGEHTQSLLPGLDHLFLDSSIDGSILIQLKAAATRGHTQLKFLDTDAVIKLLPSSFPRDWSSRDIHVTWCPSRRGHPSEQWLDSVWKYLSKHSPRDLGGLYNQPLIPVRRSRDKVILARLCFPSAIVLQSSPHGSLSVAVANALSSLGVTVISESRRSPCLSHPAILETYVHPPSVSSVLQAMVNLSSAFSAFGCEEIARRLQFQSSSNDKRALRDFIAKASGLTLEQRNLVRHLPLFETLEGSGKGTSRFVSFRTVHTAAPKKPLPVQISQELIDVSQGDSKALARLTGVTILQTTELLDQIVFKDVREKKYSGNDIDKLMQHVFNHFLEYEKDTPRFQNTLKNLPFVSKRNGDRVKPSDLFDPTVASLQNILAGEDVFPCGPVYTTPATLVMLCQLGLKGEEELSAGDVLVTARHITNMQPLKNAQRKAYALLEHLNGNIKKMLVKGSGRTLGSWLEDLAWIPTMTGPPPSYPSSLYFRGVHDKPMMKPTEVTSSKFLGVLGSVRSLVEAGDNSLQTIAKFFGWTNVPDAEEVIYHLCNVIDSYTPTEKPAYMIIARKIYQQLLIIHPTYFEDALLELYEHRWIWNGDGFSSPSTIVLKEPSIDLSPYICLLPSEVSDFKPVFEAGGVRDEDEMSLLLRVLQLLKEKYDEGQVHTKADVKRDLQLSIDVLNELKSSFGDLMEEEARKKLLIPTHVSDDSTLCLVPIEDCTYCDAEWLKQGNDTRDVDEGGDTRILYVHRNIPNDTAESLGVPSLMSRMLDADGLELGEEFGQEETLIRSINRLLEGYTDGFAVPKELIQNADDAGATEVKFLYDDRTNEDCMTCLFDEGMKACQGPALWAYNNAVFTEKDFQNITKLNGATKEGDTEKIGRFGSGFNAVYNLTDVPSFVSRNSFAIFDPHKTHLGKAIKNGKPGIRIDLKKNKRKLRKLANQFKPFNGIFGCDLRPDAGNDYYDGTLFRFPLRTEEQAVKSGLKKLRYDNKEIRELLHKFVEGAESLLLFTQTVCRVSVYHLPRGSSGVPQPLKLFEVTKSLARVIRALSCPFSPTIARLSDQERYFAGQSSFLRASSHALRTANRSEDFPSSSMLINVETKHTNEGANFFALRGAKHNSSSWLVSSTMGIESSLEFAIRDRTIVPSAGVAVCLVHESAQTFIPMPVVEPNTKSRHSGQVYCYLPLPLHSGLPVHVNGFFAVASDRRNLEKRTKDDKYRYGDNWNEVLMEDAVSKAYILALEDLKLLLSDHQRSCGIYDLWPSATHSFSTFQPLVNSFYRRLSMEGPSSLSLFSDGTNWIPIDGVVFLDPNLRSHREIGNIAFQIFQFFSPDSKVAVDLPREIMESFRQCGYEDTVKKRTCSTKRFYCEFLLPNIHCIQSAARDLLVLFAVDKSNLRVLLNGVPCIPASPEGKTLKRPQELVHPDGDASSLYSPEDEMFPHGTVETFLSPARLQTFTEKLGMRKDDITWKEVVERAQSVQTLSLVSADHNRALKRTRALIRFLNKKLATSQLPPPGFHQALMEVTFLPILSKPKSCSLRWKGDDYGPLALLAPKDVFLREHKNLVSCTRPILDDSTDGCGHLTERTMAFFGFQSKIVSLDDVKAQLTTAIASKIELQSVTSYKETEELLHSLYSYLQDHLHQSRGQIVPFLAGKEFLLVKKQFRHAQQVVFECQVDVPPYLFKLPWDLALKFRWLMVEAGVRESFDVEDYQRTLRLIKERFRDHPLDDGSVEVAVGLANLIDECSKAGKLSIKSEIYLPDTHKRLYLSSELCLKDCHWMPDEEGVKYVHGKIPVQTCINLGVNTRRKETLRKCSEGIAFGQHEKLTIRIKRILTAYPCEDGLLKELLQNADDAQATELCFIKDPRQHGVQRVFEDSWKPLQGPALCVFNNKPFTNADIAGIQNLGEGSKGDDPNKTGQYGVGFNAVYHLTDAPSFLSKGSEIGEVLCVFDPQCKFVPGATPHEPGQMFRNLDKLRETFTDVFPCYLGEHFPVENSTMFRFPLRSKKLAEQSSISRTAMTVEDLQVMMNKFKSEIFDALLFVNCVRKITLCEVAGSGELANNYEVTAKLSDEDSRKRKEFANYVTRVGHHLREKELQLSQIPMKEVSYVVDLKDNKGYHEKWLVIQRIGFESGMVVSDRLLSAFRAGDLSLLPRGGVASLLERSRSSFRNSNPKKAFCFLPLPFKTGLPVHINGHFALDHEARRGLWRDVGGGYRTDWNNSLLRWVIAPCYVSLLSVVREHLQLPVDLNGVTILKCEESVSRHRIDIHFRLFPSCNQEDTYWGTLSRGVYQYLHESGTRLLPVLRTVPSSIFTCSGSSRSVKEGSISEITWLPTNGRGNDEAFFNNLVATVDPSISDGPSSYQLKCKQNESLKQILLRAGFNLVEAPIGLYHCFVTSDVLVNCLSPDVVLKFFGSFSSHQPLCRLGNLPRSVQDTPFEDVNSVVLLLKYCKKDQSILKCLQGLPLLVTQDSTLRVFDCHSSVFLTDHVDVLPQCASEFVHRSLVNEVFHGVDPEKSAVFKVFDIESLARNLHRDISEADFCTGNHYVHWSPKDEQRIPSGFWIRQVWKFLAKETKGIIQSKTSSEKRNQIATKLRPLNGWCLLPTTETNINTRHLHTPQKHYLVPIGMADTVVNFDDTLLMSILKDALCTLSLPELNSSIIDGSGYVLGYSEPAKILVATLSNPSLVLRALCQKLKYSSEKLLISREKCEQILGYFNEHVPCLTKEDAESLRKLPFYLTAHGDLTDLVCGAVYVLPRTVPQAGMNVWQSKKETVFLKENPNLSRLHTFLGGTSWSEIDIYCKYIFKYFQDLDPKDQLVHLEYIRRFRLPDLEDPDRSLLLESLRDLRFLPAQDGRPQTASSFYDPEQPVFKEMIQPCLFPPDPFSCSKKWLPFLRQIGLVKDVTTEHFVDFARQVAAEAQMARGDHTEVRSDVLLRHLFQRRNVATEGLLEQIRQVPFVHPRKVSDKLSRIYPQFGLAHGGDPPYICFEGAVVSGHESIAWTSATLLPQNADPMHFPSYFFQISYPAKARLSNYHNYRNEIIRRLGILQEPTIDHVVSHCENVCIHWSRGNNLNYFVKSEIVVAIYRFLKNHAGRMKESRLRNVPCILVDNGHLALPCQVVVEFMVNLEIKPYLFKVPAEFGEFHELFLALGSSQVVTVEQYAMVLMEIHKAAADEKLDPNELKKSLQAVKGMFETLQKVHVKKLDIPIIYLPGAKREEPIRVFMRSSSELVFDDAPRFRSRIIGFKQMFLVDLKQCGLEASNYGSLVKLLPDRVRPRMLSSLVKESLSQPMSESVLQGSAEDLRQLLTSQHFSQAIVRLIRHEDSKSGRKTEREILESVKQCLSGIRIHGIQGLKTHVLYQGEIIPGSETVKTCFAEKVDQGWNVYLETSGDLEETWIIKVAEVVNEITGDLLIRDGLMVLPHLLKCTPRNICSLLDALGVLEDRTCDLNQERYLPEPGAFIHIEDHHLLKDAFEDFEPGEFVGYELDDPGIESVDDTPTYIYAVIIEEVKQEGARTAPFLKKYKIDIGKEGPIEVDAVDLYKFRRVKGAPSWEMVPYEEDETSPAGSAPKDLEEVMDEITELLEEAWKLPQEKRVKIIKRLFLTWHPDKNPGNEEFCTKVFQYLQNEIGRLERGEPRRARGNTSSSSADNPGNYYHGGFNPFFKRWDYRARTHRRQHDHFQADHGDSRFRSQRANPQPGEARRWFRQAKADLEAASDELGGGKPAYEWVCFKCHQAAEKALKAAQYSKDAEKTNQHNLFLIANNLGDADLSNLASRLEGLLGGSARMRYPDMTCFPKIPHDVYDCQMATQAQDYAVRILVAAKRFIDSRIA